MRKRSHRLEMASIRKSPIRALTLIALCGSLIILAFGVTSASARQLVTHTRSKLVETEIVEIGSVAVDEQTGYVYVSGSFPEITKYKPDGTLGAWSAPDLHGASTIRVSPFPPPATNTLTGAKIAVDNSNGPHQGRIYLVERGAPEGELIRAFEPNGEEVTEADPGEHWPISNADITPAQFGPRNLTVDEQGNVWEDEENGFFYWREFKSNGERGTVVRTEVASPSWAMDSNGNVYVGGAKYTINGELLYPVGGGGGGEAVDRSTDDVYFTSGEFGPAFAKQYDSEGNFINEFPLGMSTLFSGNHIAVNAATDTLYWGNADQLGIYEPGATKIIPDLTTGSASKFQATAVEVHGTANPDSVDTTACKFEYGTTNFSRSVPCDQGNVLSGSGAQEVTATISGLVAGTVYHYRLTVENANGKVVGRSRQFVPSAIPSSRGAYITEVHADSARIHAEVSAGGAPATYAVEYGTRPCSADACSSTAPIEFGSSTGFVAVSTKLEGLEAGTTYYYRIVASNQSGPYTSSEDGTFTTFHRVPFGDKCANAHVRQQTGSALLYDCRAYELVSAENAGGYDVESDLSPGQEPLGGYPQADGRALYAVHSGAIPGTGDPANHGPDPYLATRGPEGWSTEYVGIPADNSFADGPFASSLLEADPTLSSFAFGGPEVCKPCFADGTTNIPVRLSDGELIEGMSGGLGSTAEPSGTVREHFAADGKHFVFGTTAKLEPTASESGTDATLYERDLSPGAATEVISTLPDGSTMRDGTKVAELDISADGTRTVVGEAVGAPDADGNQYYHLYMHVAGSPKSIDLTPGTTTGALFDGMTADGSTVYFTTRDALTTATDQDMDTSADIYRADVSGSAATLTRVSTGAGGTGNTDACEPSGGWNSVEGGNNCDAVAIAGGGGVASQSGTIYFLSPEKLATSGSVEPEQNQANLYVATPGSAPRFVATVDTSVGKPPPPPPTHRLANKSLVSLPEYSAPSTLAVDQNTGEIYVGMAEAAEVNRWNPDGTPSNFSSVGSNSLPTEYWGFGESQVAVDSSNSPFKGDFYVDNPETGSVEVFDHSGAQLGSLTGLGYACGVAVDQSNGDVYVDRYGGHVTRFRPKTTLSLPVKNTSYEPEEGANLAGSGQTCNIDVSTDGYIYTWPIYGEGQVHQYKTSELTASFPSISSNVLVPGPTAFTVASDPATGLVYVLEEYGTQVSVYTPQGEKVETFGGGDLEFTRGLAIDDKDSRVYVSEIYDEQSGVVSFETVPAPYEVIDNPLARHGVTQAAVHTYKDFQVTPSGEFAAFPTKMPLKSSFDNGGHSEVYRYDDRSGELACVSCNPSNAIAETDASLAAKGLSLTDDGRVFFNTGDGITARDLDNKVDAYEYGTNNEGTEEAPELISTGTSPFNSSLLGVTADGKDAFFFTRDTLVPQDENGSLVKLYDARAGGGYDFVPEKVPCKASDECHGAGTQQPPNPEISTLHGAKGNETELGKRQVTCKRGHVRKHGRCIRRKHHGKRHTHHSRRRRHHSKPKGRHHRG